MRTGGELHLPNRKVLSSPFPDLCFHWSYFKKILDLCFTPRALFLLSRCLSLIFVFLDFCFLLLFLFQYFPGLTFGEIRSQCMLKKERGWREGCRWWRIPKLGWRGALIRRLFSRSGWIYEILMLILNIWNIEYEIFNIWKIEYQILNTWIYEILKSDVFSLLIYLINLIFFWGNISINY